jgi:hypothetical protein
MTILYPIPTKYFPAIKVVQKLYAKVNYKVTGGVVIIEDVCFSPNCLQHIANIAGMVNEMKDVLQKMESKVGNHVHPIIMEALEPYIK